MTPEFALCFDGRIATELRQTGAVVYQLKPVRTRDPRSVFRARKLLQGVLTAANFDIAICHSVWAQALFGPVIRNAGIPLAFFLHDVARGTHWLERLAKRCPPDIVVCNSKFTATSSGTLYPLLQPHVVFCPVSLAPQKSTRAATESVRRLLDTADDAVVILQASRMQEWKGQRLLLESLERMKDDPRWVCWIAGGAQRPSEIAYAQDLLALAAQLRIADRVRFLGQRDDVPALLNAADIFCQPNVGPEPFGIVLVEALAAGLPVVTTRMGGALEIVDDACGRLASPHPDAVADALRTLIRDPLLRAQLSAQAFARAAAISDPARRIPQLGEVLAEALVPHSPKDASARAALSHGSSDARIHALVARVLRDIGGRYETLVDVGCGGGALARSLVGSFDRYVGCDLNAYEGFPVSNAHVFVRANLNTLPLPLEASSGDLVVAVETIEHLENPRSFVRELVRVVRPGGRVIVTTPNQLSLLSKLTLLTKHQFNAFQEGPGLYPSHISALLEEDLRRIAVEAGLTNIAIHFTGRGRVPFTAWHWPDPFGGRWFSDNVLLTGVRPLRSSDARTQA